MDKDKIVVQNTNMGTDNHQFDDIVKIIEGAKDRAYKSYSDRKSVV